MSWGSVCMLPMLATGDVDDVVDVPGDPTAVVCAEYRFGYLEAGPDAEPAHALFLAERDRLLLLLTDPATSAERRAEVAEWLSRPIPSAP